MPSFPRSIRSILVLALLGAVICGCSKWSGPAMPATGSQDVGTLESLRTPTEAGRHIWGYYLISIDPEGYEYEIVPVREASAHWNVLSWLENGPCTNCFAIAGIAPSGTGTLLVDIAISHPFPTPNLTGFDVRGVPIFNGSYAFPVSGLTLSNRAAGDGELVNADGYTALYAADTQGSGPGGKQGYQQGRFASDTPPDATLNGYRRHISNDPANTRNAFYAGDSVTVTYEVDMPNGPFVFGYAVDACWAPPISKPVDDPMTDFGPGANCSEPWKIDVSGPPIGAGGSTVLTIDVYDRQGRDSHYTPMVECPALYLGAYSASHTLDGAGFSRWVVTVDNANGAGIGEYRCLVRVEDKDNDPSGMPWLDLTAYQVFNVAVSVAPPEQGWARIWGGASLDRGVGVATDSAGNIYVAGYFDYYIEFDFPEGDDIYFLDPETPDQSYLCKFSSTGAYRWSRVWGGSSDDDRAQAVAVDASGNVYVAGWFEGTADFDPGDGVESRTSVNIWSDVYLSKFDSSGNFLWVRTWGGTGEDCANGLAADGSGSVFTMGEFEESADFDPGAGADNHYSNGDADPYISKLDPSGNFQWARTWGGGSWDRGMGVAVDGAGDVYGAGFFADTVDFDPGGGVDNRDSSGGSDAYLIKLGSAGGYQWAMTWGGSDGDTARGVCADGADSVYVTGLFSDSVDLNPGGGSDMHSSNGGQDIYVSRFDISGYYKWARTWGGADMDYGNAVAADTSGNLYVTGLFRGTVDFDPGGGIDTHSATWYDIFLSSFDSSGNFEWADTWGGDDWDEGHHVAIGGAGNAYVAGEFQQTVDFNPGSGEDWHTSVQDEDAFLIKVLPNGGWN